MSKLLLVFAAAFVLVACGGNGYPLDLGDDEYALDQMLLQQVDIPFAMTDFGIQEFENERWAFAFNTDEPELTEAQLDARKRITNALIVYGWDNPIEHLAEPRLISSQSTLYEDEEAAIASLDGFCGLAVDNATAPDVREFSVGLIADGALGLFLVQRDPDFGEIFDTVVCFRTGRVVHVISQTGLAGSEDVELGVRLANRMLERIEAVLGDGS